LSFSDLIAAGVLGVVGVLVVVVAVIVAAHR
jgi:hypothetical protein